MKPSGHSPLSATPHGHSPRRGAPLLKPSLLGLATREPRSVDDLVVAGNQSFETLENVDFAGFRNDKDMSRAMLSEIRKQVAPFHPEGNGKAYNDDVRRVYDARYAQAHGVQVQAHLDGAELDALREYLRVQDTVPNVADAVRAINDQLANGQQDVGLLLHGAEEALFAERGLTPENFKANFARLDLSELKQSRDFADSWASSQSGHFLLAAGDGTVEEKRGAMTFAMLEERGYRVPSDLDLPSALSLLRDTEPEGPATNATIATAVNAALARGERDYFTLSRLGNEAILLELGMTGQDLEGISVSDSALAKAYPENSASEARAIRTRVLRDLLRVLPDGGEREKAIDEVRGADLINAEKTLSKHIGKRLRQVGHDSVAYTKMGAMQRANLLSALSKLPDSLRERIFQGDPDRAASRLQSTIEEQWGVDVRRGKEGGTEYDRDLPLQTLADLYNALSAMSKNGRAPEGLGKSTSISFMVGSPPSPSLSAVPRNDGATPFDRPGEAAHRQGKSGFFGECGQDENGNDGVVLYDDATLGPNGDGPVGVSQGEGTFLHELAHAIQLGGVPGAPLAERDRSDRLRTAEWASLSRWTEPDKKLADGAQGDYLYYYDPAVQVEHRHQVATAYGASDPSEDFAEFSPFFFKDPAGAMKLSSEKFLYFNRLMGDFYDSAALPGIGASAGLSLSDIELARQSMLARVADAPAAAGIV